MIRTGLMAELWDHKLTGQMDEWQRLLDTPPETFRRQWAEWLALSVEARRAAPEVARPRMLCELCRHYTELARGDAGMCAVNGYSVARIATCPEWRGDGAKLGMTQPKGQQ